MTIATDFFDLTAAPMRIGAVRLKVRDLGAVSAFYQSVLGLRPVVTGDDRITLGSGGTPLLEGAESYTMDGKVAVSRPNSSLPFRDAGALLKFSYPTSWNHFLSDHGTVTLALPKGQACRGTWTTDKRRFAGVSQTSLLNAIGPDADRTISTVGNEPTSRNGRASLFCDDATTVQMDFVTRRGTADGYGVARDSGGRHYLIKFGWP